MNPLRVVSISGGKDSTATLLLALENNWDGGVRAVTADTGHEHPATYEYIDYLRQRLGIAIEVVKADFTKRMADKRQKLLLIAAGVSESSVYKGRVFADPWTPERAARAAEFMHPTGNPFLDLCVLNGGFPSRTRQYCTEYLKSMPLDAYNANLVAAGHIVEEWHGVRADESRGRALLPDAEWAPRRRILRPILRWGVERVFEQHRRHGVEPNPLYTQGMGRVGCMPCVNAAKDELWAISQRFPEAVEKVREMERLVGNTSRRDTSATFFHPQMMKGRRGIDAAVQWARTSRGGEQFDFVRDAAPSACSSEYGLCE
jgi:3'-phosphoadenosine 5'-phosphosulfate sulfotransferase (PAPS reductase)/FAD synthetase